MTGSITYLSLQLVKLTGLLDDVLDMLSCLAVRRREETEQAGIGSKCKISFRNEDNGH
jgi:hypothetical protein